MRHLLWHFEAGVVTGVFSSEAPVPRALFFKNLAIFYGVSAMFLRMFPENIIAPCRACHPPSLLIREHHKHHALVAAPAASGTKATI